METEGERLLLEALDELEVAMGNKKVCICPDNHTLSSSGYLVNWERSFSSLWYLPSGTTSMCLLYFSLFFCKT